jgi:hypothetical protein
MKRIILAATLALGTTAAFADSVEDVKAWARINFALDQYRASEPTCDAMPFDVVVVAVQGHDDISYEVSNQPVKALEYQREYSRLEEEVIWDGDTRKIPCDQIYADLQRLGVATVTE